jgi:hypothetical protein
VREHLDQAQTLSSGETVDGGYHSLECHRKEPSEKTVNGPTITVNGPLHHGFVHLTASASEPSVSAFCLAINSGMCQLLRARS